MTRNPLKNWTMGASVICETCRSPIEDSTTRFLIVKDRLFKKNKMLHFHYFAPCWDVDYILNNLGDFEIFKAGFLCEESILKNPRKVENMRKNIELWDIPVTL